MSNPNETAPHWDLSNVYGGLDADDFHADLTKLKASLGRLEKTIADRGIGRLDEPPADLDATAALLDDLIDRLNETIVTLHTLENYTYSFVSTDSYNTLAAKRESELDQLLVRFRKIYTPFEAWVGSLAPVLDALAERGARTKEHRRALQDIADESRFRMSVELEALASELVMSGGGVMRKLHERVTSQLKMPFEREGKVEELPMTVIRNLANDPDEAIRRRAYETELQGWEKIREPVAFALNCVKGTAVTLARRRGYEDVLHWTLESDRIDRPTIDALMGAMRDAFPSFRRYFVSKARKLGKERMAWWDLMAPVGSVDLKYTWGETISFVLEQFATFSTELADFGKRAFDGRWIDAEPREGKVGGGFHMSIPKVEQSRILCNFDGSFDQLSTIAHELGHGFHSYSQNGLPILRKGSSGGMAETASIFCETIVTNAAIEAADPPTQLGILENQLINAAQVIVDISSRFIFESEVVKRRAEAELTADDFCELMLDAQRQTYGDGLDQDYLHPYMWLLKPHYYEHTYNFYNFPYAFGLLFGLGVYAIYRKDGPSFIPRYKELLRSTGEGKAADLAARYGIDLRSKQFWADSIKVLEAQIDRYCALDA